MNSDLTTTITAVLARAPEWVRHDLLSTDAGSRSRAEDTLAAMIAAALDTTTADASAQPVV